MTFSTSVRQDRESHCLLLFGDKNVKIVSNFERMETFGKSGGFLKDRLMVDFRVKVKKV